MNENFTLTLKRDEALILFEYLSKLLDGANDNHIGQPEENVLNKILGRLEGELSEPFLPNYLELLNEARNRLM